MENKKKDLLKDFEPSFNGDPNDNYIENLSNKIESSGYDDDPFSQISDSSALSGAEDEHLFGQPTQIKPDQIDVNQYHILLIVKGNEQGRKYPIVNEITRIGRGLDNDIVLTDIAVSRKHVKIYKQGEQITVQDLGSGNGTRIDGQRIQTMVIRPENNIEIGNTTFKIIWPGQKAITEDNPPSPQPMLPSSSPVYRKPTTQLGSQGIQQPAPPPQINPYGNINQNQFLFQQIPPKQQNINLQNMGINSLQSEFVSGSSSSPIATENKQSILSQLKNSFKSMPKGARIFITTLLVFTVLILIIGLTIKFTFWLTKKQTPNTTEQVVNIDDLFKIGNKAYTEKKWNESIPYFEKILTELPNNTKAQTFLELAKNEIVNEKEITNAQEILNADPEKALKILNSIPHSSVYYPTAIQIKQNAEMNYTNKLINEAELLIASKDLNTAREKLERAKEFDPSNQKVRDLFTQLETENESVENEDENVNENVNIKSNRTKEKNKRNKNETKTTSKTTKSKSETSFNKVIANYKSGDFVEASLQAKEIAKNSTGSNKREAETLSSRIERVARALENINKNSKNTDQLRNNLIIVYQLDPQIVRGGYYAPKIKPQLVKVYMSSASSAWKSQQYTLACKNIIEVLRIEPGHDEADRGMKFCEKKAIEFYNEGLKLQKNDVKNAQGYWRKVISMLPTTNEWYQKAYKALNNVGNKNRYLDEDE